MLPNVSGGARRLVGRVLKQLINHGWSTVAQEPIAMRQGNAWHE
jgi:hypothetical protein